MREPDDIRPAESACGGAWRAWAGGRAYGGAAL